MSDVPAALYAPIEPYACGRLQVSSRHEIYYEEVGNPSGKPVVFLHGGPGAGLIPMYRQAFDPERYRIILFDQRGCGQSTPRGELRGNTTWDIVADMERLREHLGVERWQVFGGSWGGTLAVAYAETHPSRVTEMVLRGVTLWRRKEHEWMYGGGATTLFPEQWQKFVDFIPADERGDLIAAYYERLTSADEALRREAGRNWGAWESCLISPTPNPEFVDEHASVYEESLSATEAHYMVNGAWLESDDQLLVDLEKIRHIPCVCVFGRYDLITPVRTGWDMKRVWPEMELVVVPGAGHAFNEPGIAAVMVAATDRFASSH
jgi:proline iminopeptidase